MYYNGLKHEDFSRGSDLRNGIGNASRAGISGRGVLLDWYSWALKKGKVFQPDTRLEIPVSALDCVAIDQGVEWHAGDILLIRTGFVKCLNKATDDEQRLESMDANNFTGLEASRAAFKW
jgi:hypothetical protein